MTAAIFGLLGVIVGGLLNAGVTAWQARRADAATARIGARLVNLELRQASLVLMLNPDAAAQAPDAELFPTAAWAKHRDALARTLSDQDWQAVAAAYEVLESNYGHTLAKAIAPKSDPLAPGSPSRSDKDVVLDASVRMRKLGEPSTLRRRIA